MGDSFEGRLPIADMDTRHRGLTRAIAESYLEAARVCLSRHHESPVAFSVADGDQPTKCFVSWEPPDARTQGAWANDIDTTEAGAYCCGIAGIERARELFAVRRAETCTGADYYVGAPGSGVDDLEDCLRLEVSGVDSGSRAAVMQRLAEKVQQARAGRSSLPAIAAVVGFAQGLIVMQDVQDGS